MAGYTAQLNDEQKKAVEHASGPLLIVAGAGTGKTTVITERIGHLILRQGVKPEEVLALTFTEKAAAEMEERVDQLLPYGYVDLWISTFHAFAEKILHLHALEIGVPNDFKMLNDTQQWMLVRQNFDRFDLDFYRPMGNPTKFIHALLKLFSRAKDDAITPQQYLDYVESLRLNSDSADFVKTMLSPEEAKTLSKKEQKELIAQEIRKQEEIANAYHTYQQLLLENNALDFGDLINYSLQLFQQRPAVAAKYRNQFKYILVDEFQDTNHAQYELIKVLAAPQNNITVVGDDDQSIYKFRGASVSNILEFKKDFPRAVEVFLTQNYRSTQNILDLSYRFIEQNNPDRLEVKLAKAGKKLSKKLKAKDDAAGVIEHLHFSSGDDEIRGVIDSLQQLKSEDPGTTWDNYAILSRTNDTANMFAHALSHTDIPYRFVASKGLYMKEVILDVLAYLRLLDNYHESTAVHRILCSPIFGISYKNLVQINYLARRKGYSLFSTLKHLQSLKEIDDATRTAIGRFVQLVDTHSALAREKSVSEVVITFLHDSGYKAYLEQNINQETVLAASYLNQFFKKMTQFEQSGSRISVRDFLEFIDLELESGEVGSLDQNPDEGPEAVKIMTVHAAKGLEFKYVFIVNLVDRRFPSDNRPDAILLPDALVKEILPEGDAHVAEERRLFYVAMTRAKHGLYFTSAEDYGGARRKKISRFLAELSRLGLQLSETTKTFDTDLIAHRTAHGRANIKPVGGGDIAHLLPKKYSFSQLTAFDKCPYHYWLEHILKIPQKGKNIFSFGSSIHLTLQRFFELVKERTSVGQKSLFDSGAPVRGEVPVSLEELLDLYEKNWIDDWYYSRKDHDGYKERGKQMLKAFYDDYRTGTPIPKLLETPFVLNLSAGDKKSYYVLTGKIDRIDATEDGVEIIDYKTGNPKDKLIKDDRRQLLVYHLAATQQLKEKVNVLTYFYLDNCSKLSFQPKEKDVTDAKAWIIETIDKIKAYPWPASADDCTCDDIKNK